MTNFLPGHAHHSNPENPGNSALEMQDMLDRILSSDDQSTSGFEAVTSVKDSNGDCYRFL